MIDSLFKSTYMADSTKMNLDRSLLGMEWGSAFAIIQRRTMDGLSPVFIVRTDEPKRVVQLRDYLKTQPEYIYVRLGVACSMSKMYQELFEQLKCDQTRLRAAHDDTIAVVVEKIKEIGLELTIVIDNCQFFVFDQIPTLIGLMLELTGWVRFIFLLPDDYAEQWARSSATKKNLFFNLISFRYDLS